jgi:hypothetical protein
MAGGKVYGVSCKEFDRDLPDFRKADLKDISSVNLEKLYKDYKTILEHFNWLLFESDLPFPDTWDKKFNRKWSLCKDRLDCIRAERTSRAKVFITVKEVKGRVQYVDCFDPPRIKGRGIGGITL